MTRARIAVAAGLLFAACRTAPRYPAEVQLEVDGQRFDYSTATAEWEQEGDGPISLYLVPEDPRSGQPYLCLRHYSGNPVAHVWLRYARQGEDRERPPKYECFVPGRLAGGTDTLAWKKPDGSERHRTETGEAACKTAVVRTGDAVTLDFDVALLREKKKGRGEEADAGGQDTVHARGRAVVRVGG